MKTAQPPHESREPKGPFAYENWRSALAGDVSRGAYEIPLYTDAHITGEEIGRGQGKLDLGPYALFNAVPFTEKLGLLQPTVVMRYEDHSSDEEFVVPPMDTTDDTRFHGGLLEDEIAALLSLCLGVRFRPSGITREFRSDNDPRGQPRAVWFGEAPTMTARFPRAVLPGAIATHNLAEASLLPTFPKLRQADAVALVRAARSYQQGLWVAESEPELTWLFFVSAVETAANQWHSGDLDPQEILQQEKPELARKLTVIGGDELVLLVAAEFAQTMKATAKFMRFSTTFLPKAPPDRPDEWMQHKWSKKALSKSLSVVYDYRSRALHAGKPYPTPMCLPPMHAGAGNVPAEILLGTANATRGAIWVSKDTPINLHTFEYVVRRMLLNWWQSCVPGGASQLVPSA